MSSSAILIVFVTFSAIEFLTEWFLSVMNQNSVIKHRKAVPQAFKEHIGPYEYEKSVEYSLEKGRLSLISRAFSFTVLLVVLLSGFPGMLERGLSAFLPENRLFEIAYILVFSFLYSLPGIPLSLYSQFIIEEKYGFNKMTIKILITDNLKQMILIPLLAVPLLWGLFFFMDTTGSFWWLYAAGFITLFQLFIFLLYPILIAPLFNKFTPLEEGSLKARLEELANRCDFATSGIFVMDGSKRSGHSNAYFTGFGKMKRIVLFDTLIDSMSEEQLEAVLAHEIGHNKLKHIPKRLIFSVFSLCLGLLVISLALSWEALFPAFGFTAPSYYGVLTIIMYFASPFTFYLSPLSNYFSRKHEYQADAYACLKTGSSRNLGDALLNLSRDNLSNLTPHKLFSGFYYSHPALAERLEAMNGNKS